MNNINICFIIILLLFLGLFMISIRENFSSEMEEESNMLEEEQQEESNMSEENITVLEMFDNHSEEEHNEEEYQEEEQDILINNITENNIEGILSNHQNIIDESHQEEHLNHEEVAQETVDPPNILLPVSFSLRLPIEMSSSINLNEVRNSTTNLLTSPPLSLSSQFINSINFRSGSIIIDVTLNIDSDDTYDKLKSMERNGTLFMTINGMQFKVEVFKPSSEIREIDPQRPNIGHCPKETNPVCCLEPYNSNNYPYKTHKNMCVAKAHGSLENFCKIGKCDEKDNWEGALYRWKHQDHNHTSHDHTHYYDWEKDLNNLNNVHNKTIRKADSNIIQANLKGVSSIFAPKITINE